MDTRKCEEDEKLHQVTLGNPTPGSKDIGVFDSIERRSPSPGVARRVDTMANDTQRCDPTIDDLSNKFVDALLDTNSAASSFQPATKYVSMNEQIIEKQMNIQSEVVSADNGSSSHSGDLAVDSTDHTSKVEAAVEINIAPVHLINGSNGLADTVLNPIDSSMLNIDKQKSTQTNSARTVTNWETSNGMDLVDVDQKTSQEVDILTALSGEPTPNSLPQVTDGISDGEISSDESDDNDDDHYDLAVSSQVIILNSTRCTSHICN